MAAPIDPKKNPFYTQVQDDISSIQSGSSQDYHKLLNDASRLYGEKNLPQNVIDSVHQTIQALLKESPGLQKKEETIYLQRAQQVSVAPTPSVAKELIQQMEELKKQLRAAIGPPMNETLAREVALRLESFMTLHKSELFQIAKENGFLPTGAYNYVAEYDSCLNGIKDFLQHPSESTLYITNEGLTQLTYLVSHQVIQGS